MLWVFASTGCELSGNGGEAGSGGSGSGGNRTVAADGGSGGIPADAASEASHSGSGGSTIAGSGGTITGSGGTITGSGGTITGSGGTIAGSGGTITGSGGTITTGSGGTIAGSGGTITGSGGTITGSGGTVTGSGGTITGSGGTITGSGGTITGSGGTITGSGGTITGSGGTITGSGGTITGSGGTITGSGGTITGSGGTITGSGGAGSGGTIAGPCSDLFSPGVMADYQVDISATEWQTLMQEFLHPVLATDGSGFLHPWHPITFRLGAETRTDAMIRLKGDSSWEETLQYDKNNPKAQFVIAFDKVNNKALFHGVSKLNLDMPRTDPTYLRERLGNTIMRELGEPGLCAASVRLTINGAYYGLYVVKEQFGHNLMRRIYPEAPDGDLWKSGETLDSGTGNTARLQAFWAATNITSMLSVIDLRQAVREWAAEIAINDADGYYGGDHNFYIYDYPGYGFRWLPDDLDSTFDYLPYTTNPIYWWLDHDAEQKAGPHYMAVIYDPFWRAQLVAAVAELLAIWDVGHYQSLIDAWAPQITTAVEQDPHRPVTMAEHAQAVADMRDNVAKRPEFLRTWVLCEQSGSGTDADGDGYPWCRDCNDHDAKIHDVCPGR